MAEGAAIAQRGRGLMRIIIVTGALVLSACSTVLPRGTEPAPVVVRPVPVPGPVRPGIPEDLERHRVALLVPLTGSNAGVGQSLANATQLALLDTNNQRIRVTTYDTATGAAAAANQAIAQGARLIIGPLLAEDVRAVLPIARRAGVPVLSFSNDATVAGSGAYLMGYSPVQSIERVVGYARKAGIREFAGLVPRSVYGDRASTALLRAVEDAGGRLVSIQTYDRGAGSIAAAVARIPKTSPYQAILIADGAGSAALAGPAVRRSAGPSVRLLGTELWNNETATLTAPGLAGGWFASVPDAYYRQYAVKYRARFGSAPYRLSSMGYDAVLLTVRIARDWRVGDRFPEARLVDADGFTGLDGAFRFGRDGVAQRMLEVQEVRGGTAVTVSPAPTTFGK